MEVRDVGWVGGNVISVKIVKKLRSIQKQKNQNWQEMLQDTVNIFYKLFFVLVNTLHCPYKCKSLLKTSWSKTLVGISQLKRNKTKNLFDR